MALLPCHLVRLTCVILTQGDRSAELERAVKSVTAQRGDPVQVVLVVNGAGGAEHPDGVDDVITLPENVGIPGGRNEGYRAAAGEVVIFLDDDGWLASPAAADRLRRTFSADPRLAVVAFRIVDPDTGRTERRHVPRLRAHDPHRSGEVTTFLGGACAVRRSAMETCGPFPARFFYGHEETDFAWRAIDHGYQLRYDAGITLHHPGGGDAGRHAEYYYFNAGTGSGSPAAGYLR